MFQPISMLLRIKLTIFIIYIFMSDQDSSQSSNIEDLVPDAMDSMMLPPHWIYVPLPTHGNKEFGFYHNTETKECSLTSPFDIAQLPYIYRKMFKVPLSYDEKELIKAIEQAYNIQIEKQRKYVQEVREASRKSKKSKKRKATAQVSEAKDQKRSKEVDSNDSIPEVITDFKNEQEVIHYCKKIPLPPSKVNTNDMISFLTQLCEKHLNKRPEYNFENCPPATHRCIVKIPYISQPIEFISTNKKKAKHGAADKALKMYFTRVYTEFVQLGDEKEKINQKELRACEEEEIEYNNSLIKKAQWEHSQKRKLDSSLQEHDSNRPSREDLLKVEVKDPTLIDHICLLREFTPKTLLEAYKIRVKKGSLKLDRKVGDGVHYCTVRFYTDLKQYSSFI